MELFDILKEITERQQKWDNLPEDFNKSYSQFMINRFASSTDLYVIPLAELDKYKVSNKVHHMYITSFFQKKSHYFNYKAYKKTKSKFEDTIPLIARYFEIGEKEAAIYLDLLTEKQIKEIADLYKTK